MSDEIRGLAHEVTPLDEKWKQLDEAKDSALRALDHYKKTVENWSAADTDTTGQIVRDVPVSPAIEKLKPDGWHVYHICFGVLRELTVTKDGSLCVACGQWAKLEVTQT